MFLRAAFATLMLSAAAVADDISVTVYNNNLGVISETRSLAFKKGTNRLAFTDVPALIDANSVRFSLTGAGDIDILEQNYAYDLVSSDQLMRRYIDKQIEIIDENGKLYSGTLAAYDGSTATLIEASGQVRVVRAEHIADFSFPKLPEGLITRPTLFWLYNSSIEGSKQAKVSYQTSGLGWTAEYVGVLDNSEKQLNLSGWSAINNFSGKTYTDATLKLIVGDINRATRPPRTYEKSMVAMDGMATAESFEQKEFFEYHLYTLPRKATIANNESKQISLFDPASTSVNKVYVFQPDVDASAVQVAVKFTNASKSGLGMPLPAGRVRLFKADTDGGLILLGEDLIKHTPKDEEVKLKIGNAFDIVAEEKMTNQAQISQRVEEREFEVEIRNRKKEAVTVSVEKQLWGFWEVMSSSVPYKKLDAQRIQFDVPVKASDTTKVTYKVRFSWK